MAAINTQTLLTDVPTRIADHSRQIHTLVTAPVQLAIIRRQTSPFGLDLTRWKGQTGVEKFEISGEKRSAEANTRELGEMGSPAYGDSLRRCRE